MTETLFTLSDEEKVSFAGSKIKLAHDMVRDMATYQARKQRADIMIDVKQKILTATRTLAEGTEYTSTTRTFETDEKFIIIELFIDASEVVEDIEKIQILDAEDEVKVELTPEVPIISPEWLGKEFSVKVVLEDEHTPATDEEISITVVGLEAKDL